MSDLERLEPTITVVADVRNVLGESPVWSAAENALYWTDIRAPALFRFDFDSGSTERWDLPELAGAVVLRQGGGLVLGLQSGLYSFDPHSESLGLLHRPEGRHPDDRANDLRCDPAGRLWFSVMRDFGKAPTGAVYCLDASMRSTLAIDGVTIPNAICFSPSGDRMYFADTAQGDLKAYENLESPAKLRCRSVILPAGLAPGRPDGATVDRTGNIWNARFGGGGITRSSPDGRMHRFYKLPVSRPTSCSFGGPELDTLFITTATQGLDAEQRRKEALAGSLLAIRPGTTGIAEPCFGFGRTARERSTDLHSR